MAELTVDHCRDMEVFLRRLKTEDIDQVVEIEREAFSPLWFSSPFKRDMNNKRASYLVACFDEGVSPEEILAEIDEGVLAGRGCLLCNTAIEVAPHDKEIAADIRRFFDNITGVFRDALHNAKTKAEIHPDTQIDDWAVSLTGLIQSSALMVRVGYPVATIRQNVEAALAGLENR